MINIYFKIILLVYVSSVVLAETKLKLLVPFYIDPTGGQSNKKVVALANATKYITVVAILNPDNGPVPVAILDSDSINAFKYLKQANKNSNTNSYMVGYVYTRVGKRAIATVKAEIDMYASWPEAYRPSGIFFDEVSSSVKQLSYYQQLYSYVKQKFGSSAKVFTNPGVNFPKEYLCSVAMGSNNICNGQRATDTGITFEDVYSNWQNFQVSSYASTYPRNSFALLVHSTNTEAQMKAAIDKANKANIGFVYVTNDVLDNPWDTLPKYQTSETDYVASFGTA